MSKPYLTWNDEIHSVGIRKMDEQHKQLVGLINALHNQRDAKDRQFIDKVFATLVQYTANHFGYEEKILKKIGFPEFALHHKQHEAFIRNVTDLKGQFDAEGGKSALEKLTKFLGEWLTHHILVEDKAYGKYLES